MPIMRVSNLPYVATVLVVVSLAACGRSDYRARYVPPESVARRALTLALETWEQTSDRTSLRLNDKVPIEVIDKSRRAGQTLKEFKILGEVSVEGGRWFEVELELDNPAQTEQVRYVVIGINPLWIFRRLDYEMLAHWDHPMPVDGADTLAEQTSPPDEPPGGL